MDQSLYDALYSFTEAHPPTFNCKDVFDDSIYAEPYLYGQAKTPTNFAVNYSMQTPPRPAGPTPLRIASPCSSPVPSLSCTPTSSPASSRPTSAEDIPIMPNYQSPISPSMQPIQQPSYFATLQDQYLSADQPSRLPRKASMPSLQAQRMPLPQQNTVRRASSAFNLNQQNRTPRRPSQLSYVACPPQQQQYLYPQSSYVARQHTQPLPMSSSYLTPVLPSRSHSYMSTAPSSPLSHLQIAGVRLGLEDLDLLDDLSPTDQAPPRASPLQMPMSAPAWQTTFPKSSPSYSHQPFQPQYHYNEPRYGWAPQMAPQSYYLGQENYSLHSAPALEEDGVPDYFSLQHARRRGSSVDSGVVQALPESPVAPLVSPSGRKIKKKPAAKKDNRRGSAPAGAQFVNFTSADSMKLLSGVAPSGSSKRKRDEAGEDKDGKRRVSSQSQ